MALSNSVNEEWICERVKLNHDHLGNTACLKFKLVLLSDDDDDHQ